jgi:hypothetical protein
VIVVAVECGPVASLKIGRRLGSLSREQQLRTSHLRAVFWFRFCYVFNSNTSLSMYLFCNSRIHVITLYSGHVYVYYASMLRCWHLVWILVRTGHSCLGVRRHI